MEEDLHKQLTKPGIKIRENKLPLPEQIGPYKIESLLTKGGMSLLYLGVHPKTSETVVIKVVLPKYTKNKEVLSRLLREAKILGLANHPNIVKLYDLGQWENGLFVAMEFVKGVSLRQFIKQKSLTRRRALEIVLQIAYALAHLHSHGIIHRDLKPENVLITESGDIKLIDFGISQFIESEKFEYVTIKKVKMGTPGYMSPEQKDHPEYVSYASDIFSLGIIAYELYLGKCSYGIIQPALLPKGFRKIIEKSLETNPSHRYADIVDFIADLSRYLKTFDEAKEEREEELPEAALQWVDNARSILIPKKSPHWPNISIGISIREGSALSCPYLDFLSLENNCFAIILAKASKTSGHSLIPISILRGSIRMLARQTKDPRPIPFLQLLNHAMTEDFANCPFDFSYLFLQPEKESFSFIGCIPGALLHIPEPGSNGRVLEALNEPLGASLNPSFLQLEDHWRAGSTLLLSSDKLPSISPENLLLASQPLAETALQATPHSGSKSTLVVASIQRS